EARALMQFLASPEAQEIWVGELGKLSPNVRVSGDAYPDDLTRKAAALLASADVFRFDGSALRPAAVGSGAFWEGVLNYVAGDELVDVLMMIAAAGEDAYGRYSPARASARRRDVTNAVRWHRGRGGRRRVPPAAPAACAW